METSLHRQLKEAYADHEARIEVRVGNYRIDVVRDHELIEIQHGSLAAIRDKVRKLLKEILGGCLLGYLQFQCNIPSRGEFFVLVQREQSSNAITLGRWSLFEAGRWNLVFRAPFQQLSFRVVRLQS